MVPRYNIKTSHNWERSRAKSLKEVKRDSRAVKSKKEKRKDAKNKCKDSTLR